MTFQRKEMETMLRFRNEERLTSARGHKSLHQRSQGTGTGIGAGTGTGTERNRKMSGVNSPEADEHAGHGGPMHSCVC